MNWDIHNRVAQASKLIWRNAWDKPLLFIKAIQHFSHFGASLKNSCIRRCNESTP